MPIRLFITEEEEIAFTEGTTQGDTLSMIMCASCYPLIRSLHLYLSQMFHGCGMLMLPLWVDNLITFWWKHGYFGFGPVYGY